jgi:hypothetical protein
VVVINAARNFVPRSDAEALLFATEIGLFPAKFRFLNMLSIACIHKLPTRENPFLDAIDEDGIPCVFASDGPCCTVYHEALRHQYSTAGTSLLVVQVRNNVPRIRLGNAQFGHRGMSINLPWMTNPQLQITWRVGQIACDIAALPYLSQRWADEAVGIRNAVNPVASTASISCNSVLAALRIAPRRVVIRGQFFTASAESKQHAGDQDGNSHR